MSRKVWVFLNCDTGDMEAFASMSAFQTRYPDFDISKRNDRGDTLVETRRKPWGRNIGYIQELELNNE